MEDQGISRVCRLVAGLNCNSYFFLYMRYYYPLLLLLVTPLPAYAFGADEIIAQYARNSWYAGEGITPGDSYEYLICDETQHNRDNVCRHMRLDFHIELESYNRNVWIVQANVTDNNGSSLHIFLIDSDTLQIRTDRATDSFADSLEHTVFYLAEFAHGHAPKQLRVGSVWGAVPSPIELGSEMVIVSRDTVEIENGNSLDVFVLRYGLFEHSVFAISPDLPFPVSAVAYDPSYIASNPPILFTYELLDYSVASPGPAGILAGTSENRPKNGQNPG